MSTVGHVVVLGGSMAGLLAARALSDTAESVSIFERDEVLGIESPRRGVPQGRHVHGLLARGQVLLEDFFPGFTEQAREYGIPTGDLGELRWFFHGKQLQPMAADCLCISADRPVLEHLVRERVRALGNVSIHQRHQILDLAFSQDSREVTGALIRDLDEQSERIVSADLVIDALGRSSRTPRWLKDHGYDSPDEDTIKIDLTYTSRHYSVTDENVLKGDLSINPVSTPVTPRGAFFSRVQGDDGRSIISLTGVRGDEPQPGSEGFTQWAESLSVPDIAEVISAGEPLDDPTTFKFPHSVRLRYEHLDRLPLGLLVVGDAFCSFNPVYGQGMTVAAMAADLLRVQAGIDAIDPKDFFSQLAQVVDGPWQTSAGGDLAFYDDPLPPDVEQANAFVGQVHEAATREPRVTRQFMRVAGMVDPPDALMTPDMTDLIFGADTPAPAAVTANDGR